MSLQHGLFVVLFLLLTMKMSQAYGEANGTEKHGEWFLAKEGSGISLYYRWIKLENGRQTREMMARFVIHAAIPKIVSQFSSSENYGQWAAGIKKCTVVNRNDSLWFTHALMNYPFPFKKKDLITKHELRRNNGGVVIDIVSVPEFKPETKSVERIKNYWGTWNLAYSIGGETNVECRFISGDKPLFPRFMQDPVVQKITIDSFSDLKSLAETQ